jgi:hypothetical protein
METHCGQCWARIRAGQVRYVLPGRVVICVPCARAAVQIATPPHKGKSPRALRA